MEEDEFSEQNFYTGHIIPGTGEKQSLKEHMDHVAYLSRKNCPLPILENIAFLTGEMHDPGKLLPEFRQYMYEVELYGEKAPRRHIDHSSVGAKLLEELIPESFLAKLVGTAIYSHHGLQDCISLESGKTLSERRMLKQEDYEDVKKRFFTLYDKEELLSLVKTAQEDGKQLRRQVKEALKDTAGKYGEASFYIGMFERLLLSVLIDSDWTDTACFYNKMPLPERMSESALQQIWQDAIQHFCAYMGELQRDKKKSVSPLNVQRQKISDLCCEAAQKEQALYRLTVPTGAGKTYSSLRFALYHALNYKKKHIVYVAPFNSVLDQCAEDIRKAVGNDSYVLEHHCNVLHETEEEEERYRELTETWDSPIIATSAVQMLNTLFSSDKSCIRRMQQICNSVIIFDEVQAIPVHCMELFNLAVNFLTTFCNTTVVLCTATQPSAALLKENNVMPCVEMAGNPNQYAEVFQRVKIEDKTHIPGGMSIEDLCTLTLERFHKMNSVLVIVNTKKTAKKLYEQLKKRQDGCEQYHLSTLMCAENRSDELKKMKKMLEEKCPVICVTTPLIEAGVDISFACVIRSLSGLDSIIQAAGRCNRHKELECGSVIIVKLSEQEENISRLVSMRASQKAGERLLDDFQREKEYFGCSLDSQKAIQRYYRLRYFEQDATKYLYKESTLNDLLGRNDVGVKQYIRSHNGSYSKEIKLLLNQAFRTAGDEFHVIEDTGKIAVLIPYNEEAKELIGRLERGTNVGEQKKILRKLQRYVVNLSADEVARLGNAIRTIADGMAMVLNENYYSTKTGVRDTPVLEVLFK